MGLVRELSLKLRPAMLDDLGLLPDAAWHFERFTNQTNIQVAFRQKGIGGKRFPLQVETAVYRIIQEALTNVARHAKVNEVDVRLWSDERTLGVQIEDHGVGFAPSTRHSAGYANGLNGMRERAMLLGGQIYYRNRPRVRAPALPRRCPMGLGSRNQEHDQDSPCGRPPDSQTGGQDSPRRTKAISRWSARRATASAR